MQVEDLKIFLAIVKYKNICAASQSLFISQPTLSRRLSMLEEELGNRLLVRGKGYFTAVLTPTGERFLPLAEQMVSLWEEAYTLCQNSASQRLSIALPDSIASYVLKDFILMLFEDNPSVDIEIRVHDSFQIYDLLMNKTVDIGITNGEAPYSELESRALFQEEFVVVRKGKSTPKNRVIHPSQLKAHNEIFQFFSPEYRRWHDFWWKPGLAKMRVNLAQFTVGFLHTNDDWAILPYSVARSLLTEDTYISQLKDSPPKRCTYFITPKKMRQDKIEITNSFINQVEKYLIDKGFIIN